MTKRKQIAWVGQTGALKCNLDRKEAPRRAMEVPVPDYWTKRKSSKGRKTSKRK